VPIVVVLYHREKDTRKMFKQLARVTDGYSLIIVNNGFDDPGFIKKLRPLHYIENKENTGAIRGINQGLELAEGKYVAVLHNDILIYDEGWLDHIIEFMERRPDVGLVGLGGWHVVGADGICDEDVETVDRTGCVQEQPVLRFTEVAAAKGTGWVTLTGSVQLDERLEHVLLGCDVDLSLHYQSMGFKVHSANIEHRSPSLESMSGISEVSREILVNKWQDFLPISRRYAYEERTYHEIGNLLREQDRLIDLNDELTELNNELARESDTKGCELKELAAPARRLEKTYRSRSAELEKLLDHARRLEASLTEAQGERLIKKLKYYIRAEGPATTIGRSISYAKRRLFFVGSGSKARRKRARKPSGS